MPAPGDQHKLNGATTANPFEETKPRISEYTAQEIATLQSRLNKRLGPEFISTRPGPGNQKIAYLAAEKAINLANEVFGFNGWSSSIQNIQIDFVEENQATGKVSIGLSVVVRVTLKDGTYHEDIGYGGIENCKGKAMAFEKSKKEATTDALKRALRNFGNVLGNCVYDKEYITKVSKVKAGTGKWDVNDLYRHPDFAPKEEAKALVPSIPATNGSLDSSRIDFEESFDMAEFDDVDFDDSDLGRPDEVILPPDPVPQNQRLTRPGPNTAITPSKPPQSRPSLLSDSNQPQRNSFNSSTRQNQATNRPDMQPPPQNHQRRPEPQRDNTHTNQSSSPGVPPHNPATNQSHNPPADANIPKVAGFYSARAAESIDSLNNLTSNAPVPIPVAKFNPHAESPSIRKTAGVDHTKSIPVKRELIPTTNNAAPSTNGKDTVDPRAEGTRRIGMPGQGPSGMNNPRQDFQRTGSGTGGMMSTSAYRPPTRHASPAVNSNNNSFTTGANTANDKDRAMATTAAAGAATTTKRPPLVDMSNIQTHNTTAVTGDGTDAKRQKTGNGTNPTSESANPVT